MKRKSLFEKAGIETLLPIGETAVVMRSDVRPLRAYTSDVDVFEMEEWCLQSGGIKFWHDVYRHDVGGS